MGLADKIYGTKNDKHLFFNVFFLPTTEHFISYNVGGMYKEIEEDRSLLTIFQMGATFWGSVRNTIYVYDLDLLTNVIPERYKSLAYSLVLSGTIISCAALFLAGYIRKNS